MTRPASQLQSHFFFFKDSCVLCENGFHRTKSSAKVFIHFIHYFMHIVFLCTMGVPGALGDQKRVPDLLELELLSVVNMGADNQHQAPRAHTQVLIIL